FEVVQHVTVTEDTILNAVEDFEKKIETYDIPSDGLVLSYEDIAYGQSLGRTAKFPRHSIAFKWADELRETILTEVEWSASRTGLINPVAIFEPVELEGTTVSRASVHNISIVRGLKLGIGDRITVYKANMIIPQIAENLTGSDNLEIPKFCPVCGQPTQIRQMNEVQSLYCTNENCAAKKIKSFTLFVSRDAMNIDGLSEATLEKFIDRGFIHEYADLFHLDRYREEITEMEGFGEKSYQNLIASIEQARNTTLPRVIYALGIANIGVANAKMLCKHFNYDIESLKNADVETLSAVEGVGEVIASAYVEYMQDAENRQKLENFLKELQIEIPKVDAGSQTLTGFQFVITGSLNHFSNRNDLKELIEEKGGKVTGSVTGKTTCLINNDSTSNSAKNKKAKELNVPILTEEEFLEQYGINS
uniref:helix-hairpin-helix domain-containing protein n=1 Tax=Acetatifactor sp. TaxID=1872090 RepID=UPI0040577319